MNTCHSVGGLLAGLLLPVLTQAEWPLVSDPNGPLPTKAALPRIASISPGQTNVASVRLMATLTDGSRILGVPTARQFPLRSGLGDLTIQLEQIQSVKRAATSGEMVVRFRNGDQLQGTLKISALSLTTCFGQVSLPLDTVSGLTVEMVGRAPDALDSDLVFHCAFEGENDHVQVHGVRAVAQAGLGRVGEFSGRGSYLAVPQRAAFEFGPHDQFTVATWVKIASMPATAAIVVKAPKELPPEGGWEWGIIVDGSKRFASGWERHHLIHSTTEPKWNTWYHVAVTYAAGQWKMFVNGEMEAEAADEFVTARHGMVAIGRKGEQHAFADWFHGQLGDVRIYKRALSAAEIAALQQPSP